MNFIIKILIINLFDVKFYFKKNPSYLNEIILGGITLQNNFKNLTYWMYRFIDSNHCQNNFWLEIILMGYPPLKIILTKILSQQKKYFKIILVFDLVLIR